MQRHLLLTERFSVCGLISVGVGCTTAWRLPASASVDQNSKLAPWFAGVASPRLVFSESAVWSASLRASNEAAHHWRIGRTYQSMYLFVVSINLFMFVLFVIDLFIYLFMPVSLFFSPHMG